MRAILCFGIGFLCYALSSCSGDPALKNARKVMATDYFVKNIKVLDDRFLSDMSGLGSIVEIEVDSAIYADDFAKKATLPAIWFYTQYRLKKPYKEIQVVYNIKWEEVDLLFYSSKEGERKMMSYSIEQLDHILSANKFVYRFIPLLFAGQIDSIMPYLHPNLQEEQISNILTVLKEQETRHISGHSLAPKGIGQETGYHVNSSIDMYTFYFADKDGDDEELYRFVIRTNTDINNLKIVGITVSPAE